MENLPEYIEGIPTNKHRVKERFELILSYYERLWKKLQRETGTETKNLTKFHSTSLSFGPSMVKFFWLQRYNGFF